MYVSEDERFSLQKMSASSWAATINYGFKEDLMCRMRCGKWPKLTWLTWN